MAQTPLAGRGPTRWRGFWAFFAIGFAANVVFYTGLIIWTTVSADFLHHNPNRTAAQSWHLIGVAPLFAVGVTLFGSLMPIVIAAMAAKFVCEITGRFPLSLAVILLFVCVLAALLQMTMIGLNSDNNELNHGQEILHIAMSQVPTLLMFWLWGREPVRVAARDPDLA